MATDVPFDVTMDCTKCKKALCDRIQQNFQDRILLHRELLIWTSAADDALKHVIKEELAK